MLIALDGQLKVFHRIFNWLNVMFTRWSSFLVETNKSSLLFTAEDYLLHYPSISAGAHGLSLLPARLHNGIEHGAELGRLHCGDAEGTVTLDYGRLL